MHCCRVRRRIVASRDETHTPTRQHTRPGAHAGTQHWWRAQAALAWPHSRAQTWVWPKSPGEKALCGSGAEVYVTSRHCFFPPPPPHKGGARSEVGRGEWRCQWRVGWRNPADPQTRRPRRPADRRAGLQRKKGSEKMGGPGARPGVIHGPPGLRPGPRAFQHGGLVLAGACQFGHGVGGITAILIRSRSNMPGERARNGFFFFVAPPPFFFGAPSWCWLKNTTTKNAHHKKFPNRHATHATRGALQRRAPRVPVNINYRHKCTYQRARVLYVSTRSREFMHVRAWWFNSPTKQEFSAFSHHTSCGSSLLLPTGCPADGHIER